jgi:hypothetical protein
MDTSVTPPLDDVFKGLEEGSGTGVGDGDADENVGVLEALSILL